MDASEPRVALVGAVQVLSDLVKDDPEQPIQLSSSVQSLLRLTSNLTHDVDHAKRLRSHAADYLSYDNKSWIDRKLTVADHALGSVALLLKPLIDDHTNGGNIHFRTRLRLALDRERIDDNCKMLSSAHVAISSAMPFLNDAESRKRFAEPDDQAANASPNSRQTGSSVASHIAYRRPKVRDSMSGRGTTRSNASAGYSSVSPVPSLPPLDLSATSFNPIFDTDSNRPGSAVSQMTGISSLEDPFEGDDKGGLGSKTSRPRSRSEAVHSWSKTPDGFESPNHSDSQSVASVLIALDTRGDVGEAIQRQHSVSPLNTGSTPCNSGPYQQSTAFPSLPSLPSAAQSARELTPFLPQYDEEDHAQGANTPLPYPATSPLPSSPTPEKANSNIATTPPPLPPRPPISKSDRPPPVFRLIQASITRKPIPRKTDSCILPNPSTTDLASEQSFSDGTEKLWRAEDLAAPVKRTPPAPRRVPEDASPFSNQESGRHICPDHEGLIPVDVPFPTRILPVSTLDERLDADSSKIAVVEDSGDGDGQTLHSRSESVASDEAGFVRHDKTGSNIPKWIPKPRRSRLEGTS